MTYQLMNNSFGSPSGVRKTTGDGEILHIPLAPANTDYQAFLKYQAEGGKVYGADEEVPDGQAAE